MRTIFPVVNYQPVTNGVLLEMAKCIGLAESRYGELSRSERRGFLAFAFPTFVQDSEDARYILVRMERMSLI